MRDIERLSPFVVSKVWGGTRLIQRKKLKNHQRNVGETWEVSCEKERAALCRLGTLDNILEAHELPYMVKYIDTIQNLSIQVHPHDEYAMKVENHRGKTECWVVVEAEEKSGVYLGLKRGVQKTDLIHSLEKQDDISLLLNFFPVTKGTFIFIPAGTIHAIGKGILLVEIQQRSQITYRIWDWNRVDNKTEKRPLHIEKAMDVINFSPDHNKRAFFRFREDVFSEKKNRLLSFKDFTITSFSLKTGDTMRVNLSQKFRYKSLLLFEGTIMFKTRDMDEKIDYYETILINKDVKWVEILCLKDSSFIIVC